MGGACGDDDGEAASPEAFCAAALEAADNVDPFEIVSDDVDEVKAALDELVDSSVELARTAPAEIETDVERIAASVDRIAEALRDNDYDVVAATQALEKTELADAPVRKALIETRDRVRAYALDTCDLPESGVTTTTAPNNGETPGLTTTTAAPETESDTDG